MVLLVVCSVQMVNSYKGSPRIMQKGDFQPYNIVAVDAGHLAVPSLINCWFDLLHVPNFTHHVQSIKIQIDIVKFFH